MVSVEPVALLILPIAAVAAFRQRWAFLFVLGSVPFFAVEAVTAVSHSFNPPEIAIMVLGGHVVIGWFSDGRLELQNSKSLLWLWAFLGVAAVSVVWGVINPVSVPVHPYGSTFRSRLFVDAAVRSSYVTQLVLRAFFVFAITILTVFISRRQRIKLGVRGVVYGAVFVGMVGLLYQIAIVSGLHFVPESLQTVGFRRFPTSPGTIGPVPRMYSTAGEPGYTADYLLYGFSMTITLWLIPGDGWAFNRQELKGITGFLGIALLSSTGTTGYGGLVILALTLAGVMLLFPDLLPRNESRVGVTAGATAILAAILVVFAGQSFIDFVMFQAEKMMFQARSGSIRMFYIRRSLGVFLSRPFFGAGVGSHSAPSYFAILLAETGLVGAGTLLGAHVWTYRQCTGLVARSDRRTRRVATALVVSSITLFGTNLLAKSIASLLFPWYWFALALPIAIVARNRKPNGSSIWGNELMAEDQNNVSREET